MSNLAEKYITLMPGDCMEVLAALPDNSLDSCVTDPPYHLTSIVKRFGGDNAAPAQFGKDGAYARASAGFMGKVWDGGDIAFRYELWAAVYRVLKPGAHLLAFGGTRTYHRMACAIEDAGFEIRDCIQWLYGSGFPKSHDVSKGIDRVSKFGLFDEFSMRQKVGSDTKARSTSGKSALPTVGGDTVYETWDITEPATDSARQWQGWGTALKPACEPIVLARKPLSEKTVAANVLKWGTGAINVDGCRVGIDGGTAKPLGHSKEASRGVLGDGLNSVGAFEIMEIGKGRWPANVIHDGSDEVVAGFPEMPRSGVPGNRNGDVYRDGFKSGSLNIHGDNEGSAARFFYTAKADGDDRLGSRHPTVKPLDLMQYLVRLVTPKGGTCLDPFAGTGTTGEAAFREGMHALLIEREAEYQADIKRRIALCMSGPDERARETIKEKTKDKPVDHGPLFSDWDSMWKKPFDKTEYIAGNGRLPKREGDTDG